MKRKFLLVAVACCLLVGCATNKKENENESQYVEQDGETVLYNSEGRLTISVDKIPYDNIKYNDETFSLDSLNAYVGSSDSGHGYHPYIVAEFDLSTLSEDSYYWMMKDWGENEELGFSSEIVQTFGVILYIDSDKNNLEHESMEKLKSWIDEKKVFYVFYLPDEYKYDFSDMELSLSVLIKQDETYEYENDEGEIKDLNKTNEYSWNSINWEYGDLQIPVMGTEEMPKNIRKVLFEDNASSNSESNVVKEDAKNSSQDTTIGQQNALESAKLYLEIMPFSYTGLIEQLEYENYSKEDAAYAADNCGADWNEQAAKAAKNYLDIMPFSKEELIKQLEYEGYTHKQAVYGVEQNGY